MLRDVSPHPPGPDVIPAGHLDNPLLVLVTRLPDDDDLPALLLLHLLLLLLVPLVPGHLPGVVDHAAGHQVLSLPLLGPVNRVIILQTSGIITNLDTSNYLVCARVKSPRDNLFLTNHPPDLKS